jgi:uncharacterized protein (TIGR02145 family)
MYRCPVAYALWDSVAFFRKGERHNIFAASDCWRPGSRVPVFRHHSKNTNKFEEVSMYTRKSRFLTIATASLFVLIVTQATLADKPMRWLGTFSQSPSKISEQDAYHNSSDNKSYIRNNSNWEILAENSIGQQGPKGVKGDQGVAGPQGPKGDQGIQGLKGETGGFPSGNAIGDMQYWNGTQWVMIHAGNEGDVLTFRGGKPVWSEAGPVDADGNIYHSIKIGTQTWMVENLKTTKYNDGTPIPAGPLSTSTSFSNEEWSSLASPGFCWYNNDISNKNTCGALYNWYTVNTGKLAPAGWRVPTDADWAVLENYLIANGYNYDGSTTGNKIAKSLAAKTGWLTSTSAGAPGNAPSENNLSGFTAFSCGSRFYSGDFGNIGTNGCLWWTATDGSVSTAYDRSLNFEAPYLAGGVPEKNYGFSVRLLRD